VAAGAPASGFREQTSLNVITGRKTTFEYPYMLLVIFLYLCVLFLAIAVLAVILAGTVGKAQPAEIVVFLKLIASFDFNNSAIVNASGAQTDSLIAAYALAIGIILLILAVVFTFLFKTLISSRISQRTVEALLPGSKRGFVPCSEGIYKLCYRNVWSKSRYYWLYPWESLSLYKVDEKKKRIVLKAGRMLMPLIPWNGDTGLFESLKAVVFGHLPGERQSPTVNKLSFRWERTAIAIIIIIAMQAALAGWLESASNKGAGNEQCDVGGKIHYSFRPAFSTTGYSLRMFDDKGRTLRTYCELHGVFYEILHPVIHIRNLSRQIHENKFYNITDDPVIFFDMLIIPAFAWLYMLVIVVCVGINLKFRFNVL